jgi:hypothetical protein
MNELRPDRLLKLLIACVPKEPGNDRENQKLDRVKAINKITFNSIITLLKLPELPMYEQLALIERYANNETLLRAEILKVCLHLQDNNSLQPIQERSIEAELSMSISIAR